MDQEANHPAVRRAAGWVFSVSAATLITSVVFKSEHLWSWAVVILSVLLLLSALYWLWTTKTLGPRLPSVALEHSHPGVGPALRWKPPQAQGRRKLKQETAAFVREVRAYIATHPPEYTSDILGDMPPVSTEEERRKRFDEVSRKVDELYFRERAELAEFFGGTLRYLLAEYGRRGIISENEASLLEWQFQSRHWIVQGVSSLEAAAHQL